jgi:hypothetical protein
MFNHPKKVFKATSYLSQGLTGLSRMKEFNNLMPLLVCHAQE